MRIQFFKALWGMTEGGTLREKFRLCREAGYDGIEVGIDGLDPGEVKGLCAEFGMSYIAQIYPLSAREMEADVAQAVAAGALKVVSHSGRDKWSFERGCEFFLAALDIEQRHGIAIAHETHRHRLLFTPWTTAEYLNAFPDLRITMDFSHWCVVCESLLDDMPEELDLAMSRATHVHARVGYDEGPQVPDPSAPEYGPFLERHEEWWDTAKRMRETDGTALLTITPEFGPPNYMHTVPHTNEPVADLWKVNLWMRERLRGRWRL